MPDIPGVPELANRPIEALSAQAVATAPGASPAPAPGGPEPSTAVPPPTEAPTDAPAPAPPVEKPKPEAAVQANMVRGGAEAPIILKPTERAEISRILKIRLDEALARRDKTQPLDQIDEAILRPEVMSRIELGEFNAEDLATAWFVIDAELSQKMLAVAVIMANDPTKYDQIKNIPFFGRLVKDPNFLAPDELNALKALYNDPKYREFIRDIGYGEVDGVWDGARVYKDLKSLDDRRITLEGSFYRDAPKDSGRLGRFIPRRQTKPTDDDILLLRSPVSDALDQSGHSAYRELARQTQEVIKRRAEADKTYAGLTYKDIRARDPLEALRIRQEAAGNALSQKARISAQEIAEGKRYSGDSTLIRQRADDLRTPPKDEELVLLKTASDEANAELLRAQQELERTRASLPQEIATAETTVATSTTAKNRAEAKNKGVIERLGGKTGEIEKLRTRIENLQNQLEAVPISAAPIPKGGIDPRASTISLVTSLLDEKKAYEIELDTALAANADAEYDLTVANALLDELRGKKDPVTPGTYAGGRLEKALKAVETAKGKAKDAQDALETEPSQKNRAETADALYDWATTVDGRSRLDETLTSPKFGDEYPIDKLTDTTIRLDGQVEGAERLRDLMSRTIDKNLDPERTRLRITDETLAIRIIESVPGLYDAEIILPPTLGGGKSTFRDAIELLRTTKEERRKAELRKSPDEASIKLRDNEIEAQQRALILQALPRLRSAEPTRAQIYSFINGTIDEGIRSAERGNPYLSMIR